MQAIVLLIVAFALSTELGVQSGVDRTVPDLPVIDVRNFLPAIRQQVEEARASAETHPKDPEATGKLGMLLDAYEQYAAAATCYRRAHLLEPGAFRWLFYLGWIQAAQGNRQEAVQTLGDALRMNPDYLPAQLKLAESLGAEGKWEEARDIYQSVSRAHPDCAEAHYGLGRAYASRGETKAAATEYLKACELFPPYGPAHYALALVYRKVGDATKAQQQFSLYELNKTAVPLVDDPLRADITKLNRSPVAHIRRGADLEQAGKVPEAIAEQTEALRLDPAAVQAHIKLISLYGRSGDYDQAAAHYRAALDLDPNQADLHYNYGVLLLKQQRPQDAEKAFQQALQINPFYAEAHFNLGAVYEQQGRLNDASEEFTRATDNRPNYAAAHFHLGRLLANRESYDQAIQHFLKALTPEDDNTSRYLYALAATYGRAGNVSEALKYARAAREQAARRGQAELLASIDKDIRALEQAASTIKRQ
jgi:tetratricopeptide (TPR) repeat protein